MLQVNFDRKRQVKNRYNIKQTPERIKSRRQQTIENSWFRVKDIEVRSFDVKIDRQTKDRRLQSCYWKEEARGIKDKGRTS